MRTSVAGIPGRNLPANHAIVPAAHFYADIRCRNPRQEPSSKSRHCSCSPFLCGHLLQESPAGAFQQITPCSCSPFVSGHPLQESRAGTFQQTTPLFLQPIFKRTPVAGIPGRNLPADHAIFPAARLFVGIRGNLAHAKLRPGGGWQQSVQKRLSRAVPR